MPHKQIPEFVRQATLDPKDLIVIAPCISGASLTDATANVYGDAKYLFANDLPGVGAAAPTATITASENLAAGDIVNIWDNSGTANVRKANATDETKPALGYVTAAVTAGNPATVYFTGTINTHRSGLTPGTTYWLDTTGGSVTASPPSGSGNLDQFVGVAITATTLLFTPSPGVKL